MSEQMKDDLEVLALVIAHERDMYASIGQKDWTQKFKDKADALQRILDVVLSKPEETPLTKTNESEKEAVIEWISEEATHRALKYSIFKNPEQVAMTLKSVKFEVANAIRSALAAFPSEFTQAVDRNGEPFVWRSKTPCYSAYVTEKRYRLFKPEVQKWYEPICAGCLASLRNH